MIDSAFPSAPLRQDVLRSLPTALRRSRTLWAPRVDAQGLCRLLPLDDGVWPDQAVATFLPLKKLLLPAREALWSYRAGRFSAPPADQPLAVIGVPLCDLQAVWYLDQVFAADEAYQSRRAKALLVGMSCTPDEDCRCDGNLMPLAGDLLIAQERFWALSPQGLALLQECGCSVTEELPLPWPGDLGGRRHGLTAAGFLSAAKAAVWDDEGRRCLACGACSAVCPTCYCFDMFDAAALDGSVSRSRVWDNCFFCDHGKIAGGHDFRPGRANRLRFRLEHKYLGFGLLRGQNSCVGCGRCRKACPVDIDLDRIAAQLGGEAAP